MIGLQQPIVAYFVVPTSVGLSVANIIACNTSIVNILFTSYMFFVQGALVSNRKTVQFKGKKGVFSAFLLLS